MSISSILLHHRTKFVFNSSKWAEYDWNFKLLLKWASKADCRWGFFTWIFTLRNSSHDKAKKSVYRCRTMYNQAWTFNARNCTRSRLDTCLDLSARAFSVRILCIAISIHPIILRLLSHLDRVPVAGRGTGLDSVFTCSKSTHTNYTQRVTDEPKLERRKKLLQSVEIGIQCQWVKKSCDLCQAEERKFWGDVKQFNIHLLQNPGVVCSTFGYSIIIPFFYE